MAMAINNQLHTTGIPKSDQLKGYRRKNPSELSRDKRRIEAFIDQKKKGKCKPSLDQPKQNASSSTVDSINVYKHDHNLVAGVRTPNKL